MKVGTLFFFFFGGGGGGRGGAWKHFSCVYAEVHVPSCLAAVVQGHGVAPKKVFTQKQPKSKML